MSETRGLYIVQPRDDNEPEIIAVFEAAGAEVERIHEIGDLYVELYGFPFVVEVKGKHGRYTPKQKKLRERFHEIETVTTVEDALRVIDKYRERSEPLGQVDYDGEQSSLSLVAFLEALYDFRNNKKELEITVDGTPYTGDARSAVTSPGGDISDSFTARGGGG